MFPFNIKFKENNFEKENKKIKNIHETINYLDCIFKKRLYFIYIHIYIYIHDIIETYIYTVYMKHIYIYIYTRHANMK